MLLNSPLVIASTTVIGFLFWLFVGPSVAGDAASRDIESGLHPLSYSAPVGKFDYLAGRFLAAFALNALIMLAAPAQIKWKDGTARRVVRSENTDRMELTCNE